MKPYRCSVCSRGFNNEIGLQNHLWSHLPPGRRILTNTDSNNQLQRQSPVYSSRGVLHTNTNPVTNSNNMRFVCPICGKKISTKGNLKVHLETHRPKGKYGCDICGRVEGVKPIEVHRRMKVQYGDACLSQQQVYEWSRKYRNGMTSVADAPRPGQVHRVVPPESIAAVEALVMENRRVSVDEIAKILNMSHGSAHQVIHDVLQFHKVSTRFKTQSNLYRHKDYHGGIQFPCVVCGRVYPTNSTLRAHSITHSDLRPHACPLCDKTFKRNQDLKFHINQHTGARPYQCPYCPKAFASSGNCFSHRKRMHPQEVERDRERAAQIMR
ncbi:hypothetical protein B7P43_G05936 [Cryptotermes secundus]|uniref:C2H2-type domain-containing protein n=1 Tax=Cryptotermes secundus TaxID=105785 RepID=A0A2J7QA87_9NEOP|nr:hypothetical protein B7P43_G05936 [Cryptotermes secundus]